MPLSDWPQTSAFQLSTPAWELNIDQLRGAMDGAAIFTPQSSSYWAGVNIPVLEATAGNDIDAILRGLRAGRDGTNPDNCRSIKCAGGPPFRFLQINVVAFELASGITLLALRNGIAAAV